MNNPFLAEVQFVGGTKRVIRYHRRDTEAIGTVSFHIKDETGVSNGVILINMAEVQAIEIDRMPDGPGPRAV